MAKQQGSTKVSLKRPQCRRSMPGHAYAGSAFAYCCLARLQRHDTSCRHKADRSIVIIIFLVALRSAELQGGFHREDIFRGSRRLQGSARLGCFSDLFLSSLARSMWHPLKLCDFRGFDLRLFFARACFNGCGAERSGGNTSIGRIFGRHGHALSTQAC